MSPSEAQVALHFLSRIAPRGVDEERELFKVIQSLNILANQRKNSYNGRSATAA
jgi:hypothetical protein